MRIVSHHNHHYINAGCLVCGARFELLSTAHDAYEAGEHLGTICDACMALSLEEMQARMRATADELRAEAEALDELAEAPWARETHTWIDVATGTLHAEQTSCAICGDHPDTPQAGDTVEASAEEAYRRLLRDGATYVPLWENRCALEASYDASTGWHLEEVSERGHFVVDYDGVLWSIPKAIAFEGLDPGDLVWAGAIPTDWSVQDLQEIPF